MVKVEKLPAVNLPYGPPEFPSIRIGAALHNQTNKNICFVVGGGIGDRVCSEPTLRFALDYFPKWGIEVSLICETPELFSHLKFKEVFDLKRTFPVVGHHLYLYTYPNTPLFNEFVNANLTHCVDYPSLAALRMQLPIYYKQIIVNMRAECSNLHYSPQEHVLIHPGKTWPSRTIPSDWWEKMITTVENYGKRPVLIGSETVDISQRTITMTDAIDLRGKTSLSELGWLLKKCSALITNDSLPLHLAASGYAKIAYLSTCRRSDLLLHWRCGMFGWQMKDFAVKSVWDMYPLAPNTLDGVQIRELPAGVTIDELLPHPDSVMDWLLGY